MFKFSKKIGFAAAAALMGLTAMAEPTTTPGGSLNLTEVPAGFTSIEIRGTFTINREFDGGYIEMYHDGILIRQIPASNAEAFFTFVPEGMDMKKQDNGDIHITFWNNLSDSRAIYPGQYKVTVPAGMVKLADGTTNPEWNFDFLGTGGSASAGFTVSPEADKTYSSLNTFIISLPASGYRFNESVTAPTIEDLYGGETSGWVNTTAQFQGTKCILTAEEVLEKPSTYVLQIPAGFIQKGTKVEGQEELTWSDMAMQQLTYYVVKDTERPTITPEAGKTYAYFPVTEVIVNDNNAKRACLFTLDLVDPFRTALMTRPLWCQVKDGVIDRNNALRLALWGDVKSDSPTYKHRFYICTEDSDGSDLLPTEGEYALVIPKGCWTYAGEDGIIQNSEQIYYFTVGANSDFQVVLKPGNGTKQTELQYFTITYDEGSEITLGNSAWAHLTNGMAEYAMRGVLTDGLSNEVTFALPIPLKELGQWEFTTPTRDFKVNGSNTATSGTYYIVDASETVDKTMALDPAAGEVNEIKEIHVTFPGVPGANIGQEGGSITLTHNGEPIEVDYKYYDEENKYFIIGFDKAITEAGEYTLNIAANTLWVGFEDGFSNLAQEAVYTVVPAAAKLPKPAITPAEDAEVSAVSEFTLTLPEGSVLTEVELVSAKLYVQKDGQKQLVSEFMATKGSDNTVVLKNMGGSEIVLTPGADYELVTPAGMFATAEGIAAEYTYTFKGVAGVDGVEVELVEGNVYNAQGIVILRNAKAEDLNGLAKGLYIFNGKKIIVK